ncbi:S41 family peptidase [Sinomicrobium sp. M5D2P9]
MKRALFILLLSIAGSFPASAQSIKELSETDRLFVTAKVWGFLKYYHPNVAGGALDWDQQLFGLLPRVRKAMTKDELSEVMFRWINELGEIRECKRCKATEEDVFDKNFDLSWIRDPRYFNEEVSGKLEFIRNNRFQGDHHYVAIGQRNTIEIQNEPEYKDFDYTEEQYKLLVLFRYWNIIEYFYPYKYLTDQHWDDVLLEMIPKFRNVSNQASYRLAVQELLARMDDTHARVMFDGVTRNYLPVKIKEIEGKAVVSGFFNDSIGKASGFKPGDIILRVNGMDVEKKMPEALPYTSGSNTNVKRRNAYYRILKGKDSIADITILRKRDTIRLRAKRYAYKDFYKNLNLPDTAKWKEINSSIGYMNMAHVNGDEASEIMERFMDKKAIIIDLRNYPQFIYHVVSRYLNERKKDFARIYIPQISCPGKFKFVKNERAGIKNRNYFKGKVLLLVDDESLSRSEFTVMAFQTANNVITVGSQTAGADGNVTTIKLADGTKTYTTGAGVLYPDGTPTQRTGIKIDVEVTPTIKGLQKGRDEVLERAVELVEE